MKNQAISKIELSYIIFFFLISALQIIVFPTIKNQLELLVFSEIPLSKIDFYCKKDRVINSSDKSFIKIFCEKFYKN